MSARLLIVLAAGALLAGGCGDDQEESIRDFTLREVVTRPPVPGETVGLVGEAVPLEEFGFVIEDAGDAMVVRGDADDVERGERVRVIGTVERMSQELSTRAANALEGTPDVSAPTDQGSLYIELERVEPAEPS